MKKFLGIILISIPFVLMFIGIAMRYNRQSAVIHFLIAFALVGFVILGVKLIMD